MKLAAHAPVFGRTGAIAFGLAVGMLGAVPATEAQLKGWERVSEEGPGRRNASMAYHSERGVSVLFGGEQQGGTLSGDTWEWDGSEWAQVALSGPSPRYQAPMVYDSARRVILLFGGEDSSGNYLSDTWEWDGLSWREVSSPGPAPRRSPVMAFDRDRGVAVLFGGYGNSGELQDTWEWDGSAWTQATTVGPSARWGSAMIYDGARGVSVLFGGIAGTSFYADSWLWDGLAWLPLDVEGPSARGQAGFAFDAVAGVGLLYGGDDVYGSASALADTWEWDGRRWSEIVLENGPGSRNEVGMVYDDRRRMTVLHSGIDEPIGITYLDDTWEYDSDSIRGSVQGFDPDVAICRNLTTGQEVVIPLGGHTTWNCEAHGLEVNPGDVVATGAKGAVSPEN